MLRSYKTFFKKTKRRLELVSLPHFLYDLWRQIFIMLYFINWPNFIAWLSLLFEVLFNMCLVFIFFLVSVIIYFEINHSFLIKSFFYITKMMKMIAIMKRAFKHEIKSIFHHFSRVFKCQKFSQTQNGPKFWNKLFLCYS